MQNTIELKSGVQLYYRDWGTGYPLLFVSSWALNSDAWEYQMLQLSNQGFRCIAFDRRGHGKSSDPGRGYDFDTLASDLHEVIETLGLEKVTLIGYSMGCGEIVRYLTRYGSAKVNGTVLIGTGTPFLLKTPDNPMGVDEEAQEQNRKALVRNFPQWLEDNAPPFVVPGTSQALIDWIIACAMTTSLMALDQCTRIQGREDFREELTRIDVPTLIIHGDLDVSHPIALTGDRTAALIRGSQYKVYAGVPHGLPFTDPERLFADLLEFAQTQAQRANL